MNKNLFSFVFIIFFVLLIGIGAGFSLCPLVIFSFVLLNVFLWIIASQTPKTRNIERGVIIIFTIIVLGVLYWYAPFRSLQKPVEEVFSVEIYEMTVSKSPAMVLPEEEEFSVCTESRCLITHRIARVKADDGTIGLDPMRGVLNVSVSSKLRTPENLSRSVQVDSDGILRTYFIKDITRWPDEMEYHFVISLSSGEELNYSTLFKAIEVSSPERMNIDMQGGTLYIDWIQPDPEIFNYYELQIFPKQMEGQSNDSPLHVVTYEKALEYENSYHNASVELEPKKEYELWIVARGVGFELFDRYHFIGGDQ